jgi:hypothetical protein
MVLLALVLVACGGPAATTDPAPTSASPGSTAPAASDPPVSPEASVAPAGSTGTALDPAVLHACFGLNEVDCGRALDAAATVLPADFPVGYVQVGPFGCETGEGCDTTLLVRPAGQVIFEPTTGEPIAAQVTLEGGELRAERGEAFMVRVAPQSPPQALAGPVPFSLGHCGVGSGIDVDGSWWDPVGFVDGSHGDAINAAEGTFVATDQSHATFTSQGGFTVNLLRRVGEKHLPLCM